MTDPRSPARPEDVIRAAQRYLLRHDSQFYGPMKGERCGCDECKVIRPLVAALASLVARQQELEAARDEALQERDIHRRSADLTENLLARVEARLRVAEQALREMSDWLSRSEDSTSKRLVAQARAALDAQADQRSRREA